MSAQLPREVIRLTAEARSLKDRRLFLRELEYAKDRGDLDRYLCLDETITAIRRLPK